MSSALSITAAVNPPRAVYLDYPLGRTAGEPGTVVHLPYEWSPDDSWKDRVMRPDPDKARSESGHADDRVARHDSPQYQTEADAEAADTNCPTCVFLEDAR